MIPVPIGAPWGWYQGVDALDNSADDARARGIHSSAARLLAGILVSFTLSAGVTSGQLAGDQPLQLQGLTPAGGRTSVTEAWGTLQFTVINPNASGRDARVTVYYAEAPDVQYARDVWVPGRSSLTTWLTVGPASGQRSDMVREFRTVLQDRTGGANRVVLPPGNERLRSRSAMYRKREQTTSLMVDLPAAEPGQPEPTVPADALTLARLPRADGQSEHISIVHDGPLPLSAEALDGVDVFVLAGNRLATDPPGRAALRRWVEQGGRLWVMLDRVDSATLAPILGDDGELGIVDRVGLTTVRLRGQGDGPAGETVLEVEQPVPFVRVIASATDRVLASVDGWPAAFARRVGRGKVVFTTLGAHGWCRPRIARDGSSPFPGLRDFPIPSAPVTFLTKELHPQSEPDPLPPDVFQPMLAEEIGYSVVGRGMAAAILGGFVVTLGVVGVGLRRSRHPALFGALVPVVAGLAAVAFVALGERSRRAIPPTVGLAAMVDPVPGSDEAVVSGLYAVYRPASGPAAMGTRDGSLLGLDAEGLDGQTRVRVQTDIDAWHWDGLSLPAGTRTGSIRTTLKTGRIAAVARFGPEGIEGKLTAGTFGGLSDAIIATRSREPAAIRFGAEGTFASGPADILPAGQYLTGSVLTDRQQRRQAVYRQLHTGTGPRHLEGRDLLMVWADAADVPILREEGARVVGSVLLAVPLEFERTPADTRVTVPRGLIPYKRVAEGKQLPVTLTAPYSVAMRLRFQMPPSVLPLRVERATLSVQVRAPFRRVTVTGGPEGKPVPLFEADAPIEPIRIEITDASLLRLDEQGGLHLNFAIGEASSGAASESAWKIETLSLEVNGRTGQ